MERFLLRDLVNLLADYVEYDQAKRLRLRIDPARIKLTEWEEGGYLNKDTLIDGQTRKGVTMSPDGVTLLFRYKNGEKEGKQRGWWPGGNMMFEGTWREGKQEGPQYGWYSNGAILTKQNYRDGKYNGIQYQRYDDGRMASIVNYVAGVQEGLNRSWNSEGVEREPGETSDSEPSSKSNSESDWEPDPDEAVI